MPIGRTPPWCLGLLLGLALSATAGVAKEPPEGHWEGVLEREGAELRVSFDFARRDGKLTGSFNCEAQRAIGIPLRNVAYDPPKAHFELAGDSTTIVFEGELSGDSLQGELKEDEGRGIFHLRRTEPQPAPYREEGIRFQNGEVVLSGALFIPGERGPRPAVVFLHGSGGEGRFASRFLADYLARRGIAALIYDKRGVGASGGDWKKSDFHDLAGDALAAVRFLQQRPEIARGQIGLYGHSQGGVIAALAASRSTDVAFVISASSYVGRLSDQDLFYFRNALRARGVTGQELSEAMEYASLFIKVARSGEGWPQLEAATGKARGKAWLALFGPLPRDHWSWEFHRRIGDLDSREAWAQVRVPLLAVYGERDEVQEVQESLSNLEKSLRAAGNSKYAIVVLPKASHGLHINPQPGQPFQWWQGAPGFPDLVAAWVLYQAH